jgi:GntR family transcriptional regulator
VNLVEEVRQQIVASIADGTFAVGESLPNEQEMSERFEVSRATVREAYRGLIDAGYLTRKIGTGTFVSMVPRQHALDVNLSYTGMIRDAGFTPSTKVL